MTQSTKTSAFKQAFTWIIGIITFVMVLAACGFLIVSKNKIQDIPAETSIDAMNIKPQLLTPLALEGRDIYTHLGCPQCHQGKTIDASLVLAGGLFASSFPFREEQLKNIDLNTFLTGKTLEESHLPFNLGTEPSDDLLAHTPLYPQLNKKQLMGYTIQAKMIASTERGDAYSHEEMVKASAEIAGSTEMEALKAYLDETAIQEVKE